MGLIDAEGTVYKIEAIRNLVGGRINGDGDANTVIYRDGQKAPTEAAINAEMKRMKDEWVSLEYARNRKAEYPTTDELIVALYDTDDKKAIEEKRAAIKKKWPKDNAGPVPPFEYGKNTANTTVTSEKL